MPATNVKRILITGAAGGVGHRLCHLLIDRGLQVRGLVRPEDDTRRLTLGPEDIIVGDIQDPEAVRRATEGVDAVVHCAGLLPDAPHANLAAFRSVNVEGTRNVMREAIRNRAKWVFTMSTISVVDHITRTVTPGELTHYVPQPDDAYLASKIEAEVALRDMRREYAGELAILRLAYVYGPGNFAVWQRPLQFLRADSFKLLGNGRVPFPMIYADDIGRVILALLEAGVAGGHDGIHIVANPQPTTLRDVFDFIADYLHVGRAKTVPLWIAQLGASVVGVVPRRWRWGRLEMLTPARVLQFSRGYDLSAVVDRSLMDRVDLTDYRDGLAQMLADYLASEPKRTPA